MKHYFQSPAVQPGRIAIQDHASLALSRRAQTQPAAHGPARRQRRADRDSQRLRLALHLAQCGHILAQSRHWLGEENWGNFLFEDREGGHVEQIGRGVLDSGGHLSYLPGKEWILNDTYPKGKEQAANAAPLPRAQRPADRPGRFPSTTGVQRRVASRHAPAAEQQHRCVCINAPHEDEGRQMHLIDIRGIVA